MSSPILWSGVGAATNLQNTLANGNGQNVAFSGPRSYIPHASYKYGTTTWTTGTVGTLTNGLPTGTPTFGSGAAGTFTVSSSIPNVLFPSVGPAALQVTSTAATTVGNMIASPVIALDFGDAAKVLQLKVGYLALSPTAINFSGTSSNSFAVAIWDVTNSVWLGQSGNFGMTQASGVGYLTGVAQMGATTSQVRVVLYCANATTASCSVILDDIYLGPQISVAGAAITDLQTYTPTYVGLGTVTLPTSGGLGLQWSRQGQFMVIQGDFVVGTPTASIASISLPNGLVASSSVGTGNYGIVGRAVSNSSTASAVKDFTVLATPGSSVLYLSYPEYSIASNGQQPLPGSTLFAANNYVSVDIRVPIVGWSSNVQMSSDTDTRVVAARVSVNTTAQAWSNSSPTLIYPTVEGDTHGAYNSATGVYTVPVSGWYAFEGQAFLTSQSYQAFCDIQLSLYRNGTLAASIAQTRTTNSAAVTTTPQISGGTKYFCYAGDLLTFRGYSDTTTTTFNANAASNNLTISRLSGPAVIAATESVCASYGLTTAQSVAANGVIKYDTKIKDTHNAYSVATGLWTCPTSGEYMLSCNVQNGTGATGIYVVKNGTAYAYITSNTQTTQCVGGNVSVSLLAGDTIGFYTNTSVTVSATSANGFLNNFSITRTGN